MEASRVPARPRWDNIDDFLDNLPRVHCAVKPPDNFCSVCLRINNEVAFDCPLRFPSHELHRPPQPTAQYAPPPGPAPYIPPYGQPTYPPPPQPYQPVPYAVHPGPRPAVPAPVLAQGPVIEFARNTEPHHAPKRMKAKAVSTRGDARPAPRPPSAAPPPMEPEPAQDEPMPDEAGGQVESPTDPAPPPSTDLDAPEEIAPRRRFRQR